MTLPDHLQAPAHAQAPAPASPELPTTGPPHGAAAEAAPPVNTGDPQARRRALRLLLKAALAVVVVLILVVVASTLYRPQLEALARQVVARFGVGGMLLGTALADGMHFPVPPQFYLLTVVASGGAQAGPLGAICLGSLLGGSAGYLFGRFMAAREFVRARFQRSRARAAHLFTRHGLVSVLLLGLSPVPFSTVCQAAGFYRMSPGLFLLYIGLRIPRLLFFYALIRLGWR